ncbi:MAG: hypothetical protein WD016_09600 [Balneolaceae bacterium]
MSRFLVNKCICHNKEFSEVKKHAEEKGYSTVKELQAENYCSNSCGLCIPYVEMVLETGDTEFEPGAYYKKSSSS